MRRTRLAERVIGLHLADPDGARLPDWEPGAHLDVHTPVGVRQYSLCGDRFDPHTYQLAVLRTAGSRGGARYLHQLRAGDSVTISPPRSTFRLTPTTRAEFIAAGIGITPLLPMITDAQRLGIDWHLTYLGRTRAAMAFHDHLAGQEWVSVHTTRTRGRPDISALLTAAQPERGGQVFACGPRALLEEITHHTRDWPAGRVRTEHFTPHPSAAARDTGFTAELATTGEQVTVHPGQTLLDALAAIGRAPHASCRQGSCGTCLLPVRAGNPEHRDALLTGPDRHTTTLIYPCVSRAHGHLVLDH